MSMSANTMNRRKLLATIENYLFTGSQVYSYSYAVNGETEEISISDLMEHIDVNIDDNDLLKIDAADNIGRVFEILCYGSVDMTVIPYEEEDEEE